MNLSIDFEELRKKFKCKHYLETGLYNPEEDISVKKALSSNFDKVFSIEICKHWVDKGNDVFKKEIEEGRYKIILDDSSNLKYHLEYYSDIFCDKTLFFLDAHVDNINIENFKHRCPLFDELDAIGTLQRKDHIILIDDLRIIKEKFPWGETGYGDIDFLKQIINKILSINKNYIFYTLNNKVADNDVLCAYVM